MARSYSDGASASWTVPTALATRPHAAAASADLRSIILTVSLGDLLVQLGLTPVMPVIPALAATLGVSATDGAWTVSVFVLALAGTLLVAGRLGDLIGHRRLFGLGALVYAGGAFGAGVAPGFAALLVARAVQGLGAALISGNNLAILTRAVPAEQRGRAIAVVATIASVGSLAGAGLGTLVVALGLWQLLFFGVVPLGLLAFLRARGLPASGPEASRVAVDWAGAALLVVATTIWAVALNHPHSATAEPVMPVFHTWLPTLGLVAVVAFVLVERRVRAPLLDWRQLRNAAFAAAVLVNFVLHGTMMGAMFLGPLLVVRGLGLDTAAGGMLMVAVQLSVMATAYLGGWLHDRTRSPLLRPIAVGVIALGLAAWAGAALVGSYPALVGIGLLAGAGTGVLMAVNNTVIMGILPASARGVASGMLETTRHFGHAFGITVPTALLALVAAGAAGQPEPEVIRQGFSLACLLMAGIAALGVLLALVHPRGAAADRFTPPGQRA